MDTFALWITGVFGAGVLIVAIVGFADTGSGDTGVVKRTSVTVFTWFVTDRLKRAGSIGIAAVYCARILVVAHLTLALTRSVGANIARCTRISVVALQLVIAFVVTYAVF